MNIVEIMGNLGADPETRVTPSGQKLTILRLASNSRRGGKDETTWWRVLLWGDHFDRILPYLKKGSSLIVVGEMQKPEIYTDKEGRSQISLQLTAELIRFSPFGSGKSDRQTTQEHAQAPQAVNPYAQQQQQSFGGGMPENMPSGGFGHQDYAVGRSPMPHANENEDNSMPF